MIKKKIGLMFSIIVLGIFYKSYSVCEEDSLQQVINNELIQIKSNTLDNSNLNKMNIILPDCKIINSKQFNKDEMSSTYQMSVYSWLFKYLNGHLFRTKTSIFLTNMENGDDWVIGSRFEDGKYLQYIDSRTITVIIQHNINLNDTINLNMNVRELLSKYLHLDNFGYSKKIKIELTKNANNNYEGELIGGYRDSILIKEQKNLIWVNEKYLIIDITKLRMPLWTKFGYSGNLTVGGISKNDSRNYIRFKKENRIDFNKEMIKIFPWVPDSAKIISERMNKGPLILPPTYPSSK